MQASNQSIIVLWLYTSCNAYASCPFSVSLHFSKLHLQLQLSANYFLQEILSLMGSHQMKQSQGLLPQVIRYPKTLMGIQVYSPLCKQSGNIFGAAPSSVCKLCVCVFNFQEDRSDVGTSPPN